jgi:hypothetical protein
MKENKVLQDKLNILELEISTLAGELEKTGKLVAELEEIKSEIRALKVFIGRKHPGFKKEFLDIVSKVKTG